MKINKSVRILSVLLIMVMLTGMTGIDSYADVSEKLNTYLYYDGTLIINIGETSADENIQQHGEIINEYHEIRDGFINENEIPWKEEAELIKCVETGNITTSTEQGMVISDGSYLFSGLVNVEEINIKGFDFSQCRNMTSMFEGSGKMELKVTGKDASDGTPETGEIVISEGTVTDRMFKNANICCNLSVKAVPDSDEEVFLNCNEYDQIKKKHKGHITIITDSTDTEEWADSVKTIYKDAGIDFLNYDTKNELQTYTEHYNGEKTEIQITDEESIINKNTEKQKKLSMEVKNAVSPVMLAAKADTIPVKYADRSYSYYANGSTPAENMHAIFTTTDPIFKGHNIICGEHHVAPPVTYGNTKNLPIELYNTNQMVRKVMYYGWKGVKPWSGFRNQKYAGPYYYEEWCGVGITSNALTKAYGGKGSYDNVCGLSDFYNYCKKQPDPPKSFQVYKMEGGKTQDLFTWRYTPKCKVEVKKVSSEAGDTRSLKGALYGVYQTLADAQADNAVYNPDAKGNARGGKGCIHIFETDENGNTTPYTGYADEYYYIRELKAPPGFKLDPYMKRHVYDPAKGINYATWQKGSGGPPSTVLKEGQHWKVTSSEVPEKCTVKLKKVSSEAGDTRSLKGALYGLYNTFADAQADNAVYNPDAKGNARGGKGCIHIFETDENGNAPPYTGYAEKYYYIRELKAPPGFKLDPYMKRHVANDPGRGITDNTWQSGNGGPDSIRMVANETWDVISKEVPEKCTVKLKKVNANPENNLSLKGALYGLYNTFADAQADNAVYNPDAKGNARGGKGCIHIFETDENGNAPPYTGYAEKYYYIRELKAPPGFKLDPYMKRHVANDPDRGITDNTWQSGNGGPDSIRMVANETWTVTSKEYPEYGNVRLIKTVASNEHLVKECPERYNLKGAEYSIYKTEADALNNRTPVGVLTTTDQKTGADGNLFAESNSLNLPAGNYWIKETRAPKGYRIGLNEIPESITVTGGNETIFKSEDEPEFDPLSLRLEKHIPEGKHWTKKYLKDAEYTVRYYPEFYNTEEELKDVIPMRTWVFRTDSDGIIKIDEINIITGHRYHVGGDELFKEEDGTVIGLWGTYTFEETKAPPGFLINKGITIRQMHQGDKTVPDINDTNIGDAVNVASEEPERPYSKKLTVGKKIAKENVYKPYGYPTAIFEIEGTDVYGKKIIYHEAVTLDESTFDGTNYYAEFTLNNLPAGEYRVSEIRTSRYKLKNATVVAGQGKFTENTMIMNLINSHSGKVVFENEISRWNDYSHSHCIVNQF